MVSIFCFVDVYRRNGCAITGIFTPCAGKATKKFIEQNIGEANLEETAAYVRMNPSSFSRKFKQETGITFIQYLTTQRIELAKQLLKNPIIKVNEICHLLGYRDTPHFSRTFKKYTELTPEDYRKLNINGD